MLRVCCTQAYRVICLPWAAVWKIHRFLLFRKMTEYLLYNPSMVVLLPDVRCAVLADNKKKSLYVLCSDSALMVTSHKHMLKCSTLMRSTEPATSHPRNLQSNVIILSDLFLNPGCCLWRSIETELCLIQKMMMGHRAASNHFSVC